MAEITRRVLRLSELESNTGQIEGVPGNPRQWTAAEVDRLAKSIRETPELLTMRPPIVTPHGEGYVVLGGNMRVQALRKNKATEVECEVVEGISAEKAKEIVIKDNGAFGSWDYDALANEWDDLDLDEWGVDGIPELDEPSHSEKETKDKMTIDIVFPLEAYEVGRIYLETLGLMDEKDKVDGLKLTQILKDYGK